MKKDKTARFWKQVPLDRMSPAQWESLCDGCGRCCLRKILFEDTGEIAYTNVVCRYLDTDSCRCSFYDRRSVVNPECLVLSPENLPATVPLLPDTCAYRLIWEGSDLPFWHHLVSGDPDTVHAACISVRGLALSEEGIPQEDLENYIVDWV